jgi:HPt (histidine-containing phosphotransfer) domain-containing protein
MQPSPVLDATAEAELPLIDAGAMRDWCGDMDKADVLDVLARVPHESARCLADMRKAIVESDLASARRTAHRLKGMASNLGAARLARVARTIELASGSIEDVSSRMASLEQTSAETLEAIRAYC